MNKEVQTKKLKDLYHKVGLMNNLNGDMIKKIHESQFEFAKQETDRIDISKIEDKGVFNELKTNFLFKFLGKLYADWRLVEMKQKQSNAFKLINKKRWKN